MNPLKIALLLSGGCCLFLLVSTDAGPFLDLPLSWGEAEQDRAQARCRTWQQSSCEGFKTRSEA